MNGRDHTDLYPPLDVVSNCDQHQYRILEQYTKSGLSRQVMGAMRDGWRCAGGVEVLRNDPTVRRVVDGETMPTSTEPYVYLQAMVR